MGRASGAPRRSSEQVKTAVLAAARGCFREKGYQATTREIAERSGVAESVIFKQFGSKAELLRLTIVAAFTEVIDEWVATWEGATVTGDISEMTFNYLDTIHTMARQNAQLLRELMSGANGSDEAIRTLAQEVSRYVANAFGRVQRVVRLGAAARGYPLDDALALAVSTSMAISTALFSDWFLPDECRDASPERLVREMQTLCLYGITARPSPK